MIEDAMTANPTHTWKVFRAGGFDQVQIRDANDIAHLDQLDQKLWVALACPVSGLELDEASLRLVDAEGDGRIRVPEVVATGRWITGILPGERTLFQGSDALKLADLSDSEQGVAVRVAAVRVQTALELETDQVTLAQVQKVAAEFAAQPFNGDGVVCAAAATAPEVAQHIQTVVDTMGGVMDASGDRGVDTATLDAFFDAARAYVTWWDSADDAILPLGDATKGAAEALQAVSSKIDDWFTRAALVAFDPRAEGAMNRPEGAWTEIAADELSAGNERIAAFPIAHVVADGSLPLTQGVNPAWAGRVQALRTHAVVPLLGELHELTAEQWADLKGRLAPFLSWQATKAGGVVEGLGLDALRALLAGPVKDEIAALIAQDLERKPNADGFALVEKVIRLQRDFVPLLENFINFSRFYDPSTPAAFQTGTLYLDKRSCELVVRVDDAGKHAQLAGLSYCYLAYLTCTRKGTSQTRQIAAAFTNGDVDFLMVGRNGVFYDRAGNDWDATITKVVANPISVRQAFWAPYKRVAKAVEDQIQKFAASKDKEGNAALDKGVTDVKSGAPADGAAPAPAPFDIAKFAGIFAAAGLAVGAIASGLALLASGFMGLTWWQMPLAVAAILLIISGPSMLLAALKLRQRNLAPVLEANGWAINSRARINIPFGESLTNLAELPAGTQRELNDPYEEKQPLWPRVLVVLALLGFIAWQVYSNGLLDTWLG